MDIILLSFILGGLVVYYLYLTRIYNYWRNRGIPCAKGIVPGFGHMWPMVSLKMSIFEFARWMYESYPDHSMVGFYDKTTPALLIREPNLVKTIMQTDFTSFSENMLKVDPHLDPLFAVNPFFSSGSAWHTSRKRLIHAFSGKKLKVMFNRVEQVCKRLEDYLDRSLRRDNGVVELELRDLFCRYTAEVIAEASFGIAGACFENELRPTSFAAIGKLIFDPTPRTKFSQTVNFFLPVFNKIFRVPIIPKRADRFFRDMVKETLHIRRQDGMRRNDFLQLMVDLDRRKGEQLDEDLLTSDVFSFFADGYDTTSVTMSFVGYQIAQYPDVQERLRDEVKTVLAVHDNQITYESLKEMSYMEQVISESQRLYPVLSSMGKVCTEEFELKGSDGLCCRVQPGTKILVPVYALHRDPKYWSDPNTFDPDRFAADRKTEIEEYTYLPFSRGPRICPGKAMGLLQLKTCLATLISRYTLEASQKTRESSDMEPGSFLTAPTGGLWIYVKRL